MNDFAVEKLIGHLTRHSAYPVCLDGEGADRPHDVDHPDEMPTAVALAYEVYIYDSEMLEEVRTYPITSDSSASPIYDETIGEWLVGNNQDEVIKQIQADFPPDRWQNNYW